MKFQSRNRESYCFKGAALEVLLYVLWFVAIPRATIFRVRGDDGNTRRIDSKRVSSGFLASYDGTRFFCPLPLTAICLVNFIRHKTAGQALF